MTELAQAPWAAGVAVLGAGIMGRGIARAAAGAGWPVSLYDIDPAGLAGAERALRVDLERSQRRGLLDQAQVDMVLAGITTTTSLESAVAPAGLVIEAVPEVLALKQQTFAELARLVSSDTVLATNTSSLSVTAIAAAASGAQRVVGLHFFNPVHRMDLVEIVRGLQTDEATIQAGRAFCASLGKTVIVVQDRAGFVTSRINAMIGNEAFHMLMEGLASAEDIDLGLKLGLHHPMGPFELVDLVGLDTRLAVLRRLQQSYGERFRPNPLLVSYVEAGRLGRKTGQGVYRYDANGARIVE
jgi:3-hydroxybutyryl-CoA dehydrogenase